MRPRRLLCTVLTLVSIGGCTPRSAHSLPRGIAWRDTIQARIDASQPALAESLARVALEECEADSGAGSLSIGRLSRLLGVAIHRQRGATYERAWPPFELAGELVAKHLGRRSLEYGNILATQSAVMGGFGRFDEAVVRAKEAIALFEKQPAPLDTLAIRALLALGGTLGRAGRPAAARPAFERAARFALRMSPPDSLRAAVFRLDAALAAIQDGDLVGAEAILDASQRVIAATLEPTHPDRVRSVNIRLTLLRRTEDLLGQLQLLDLLVAQLERGKQPDAILGSRLRERAIVHSKLGDEPQALEDMGRAARQLEGAQGLKSGATINVLFGYSQLLDIAGETARADSTWVRAMQAAREFEKQPGEHTAFGYASRAVRLYAKKQYVAAREGFEQAAMLHEASQGPKALDLAATLIELARVTAELGLVDTTHVLAEKARRILQPKRAPEHPDFGDIAGQQAWAEARAGDPTVAWDFALVAAANHLEHMRLVQPGLPEQQALEFARGRKYRLAIALAMADQRAGVASTQDAERIRATWEALLLSRGIVLEQLALRRHKLRAGDAVARTADSLYRLASTRYSRLLVSTAGSDSTRDVQLTRARMELEAAERAWVGKLGSRNDPRSKHADELTRLRARLTKGQALVGIAEHERVAGRPAGYVAFIARGGEKALSVVSLGAAETMDSLVTRWRATADLRRATTPEATAMLEREATAAGKTLRERMWDPLARSIGDAREVYLVPDGELQLVNPAALPDAKGGFLIESGPTFILLTRELDLLSAAPTVLASEELLAIGAPDFDLTGVAPQVATGFRGATEGCARFREIRFSPLLATGEEVRSIAANRPGTMLLTGALADEASFKREAPRHRVVHLATHGFFLGEGCIASTAGRGIGGLAPADPQDPSRTQARSNALGEKSTNPLRLSGLALAGANRRAEADQAHEDGILTAEEIAALDLSGVERVVLSACHTGVGEVLTGEGVTGLRRAFRVAGARTQVMSLWDVDDRASAEWMVALHRGWAAGVSTAEAVRAAGRAQLAARRASGRSTHPAYWGAFVAVGDPR